MHSLSSETRRILEEHLKEVVAETTAGRAAVTEVMARPDDPHREPHKELLVAAKATLEEAEALRERLKKETDHEAVLRDVVKAAGTTEADMRDASSATRDNSRGRNVVLRRIGVVLAERLKAEVPAATYERVLRSLSS